MKEAGAAMLSVCEIFRSIQGESTFAGLPCVFVRLSGCNLRCRYCDTTYASAPGEPMIVDQVLARVATLPGDLVEVTGGEPLLQPGTPVLLEALAAQGRTVLLETNGSLPLPSPRRCRAIMDLKCPSSGEADKIHWENLDRLQPGDELKFVMSDRADFDWAVTVIRERRLDQVGYPLLFSPAFGALDPRLLADWILDSGLTVRLHLQLHRLIWPGVERGV